MGPPDYACFGPTAVREMKPKRVTQASLRNGFTGLPLRIARAPFQTTSRRQNSARTRS